MSKGGELCDLHGSEFLLFEYSEEELNMCLSLSYILLLIIIALTLSLNKSLHEMFAS